MKKKEGKRLPHSRGGRGRGGEILLHSIPLVAVGVGGGRLEKNKEEEASLIFSFTEKKKKKGFIHFGGKSILACSRERKKKRGSRLGI